MSLVQVTTDGGVCTVALDDPERRNALSAELVGELVEVLDEAEADSAIRVIVLTNTGSVFCAGADLAARTGGGDGSAVDPLALFGRFRRARVPYVGRIAGHCVAGGMGLAAAMDLAVAVDHARFGFTEVRVGVAPAMISVLCLPKLRPVDAAAAMLRGRRFSAAEAATMGLINAAVPADRLDAEVDAAVADLLEGGPEALAATKQLLAEVPAMDIEAAFAFTSDLSARLFQGDEAAEGMAAFLEKRPPTWSPTSSGRAER